MSVGTCIISGNIIVFYIARPHSKETKEKRVRLDDSLLSETLRSSAARLLPGSVYEEESPNLSGQQYRSRLATKSHGCCDAVDSDRSDLLINPMTVARAMKARY